MKIACGYISLAYRPIGGSQDRGSGYSVSIKRQIFLELVQWPGRPLMHGLSRMKSEQILVTVSNYPDFMSVSIHFYQVTVFNGPEPIHVLELCLL